MRKIVMRILGRIFLIGSFFLSVVSCDSSKDQGDKGSGDGGGKEKAEAMHQDWPLFRRDAEMQGVSNEDLKAPLKLAWEFHPPDKGGEGDKEKKKSKRAYPILATAVIAEGLVYVGSEESRFFCLDLNDGKLVWEFKAEGPVSGSAAVVGDRVFFGCQNGFLYALERKSGKEVWRFETDDKIEGGVNALDMKEAGGEGTLTSLFFGSYDNHLYAVNADTGKLIWKYETENYLVATPSVVGGENPSVIVGGCDGLLHVISARDGTEVKNFEVGAYIPNSAGVRDGVAYLAHFGGEVGAYDVNAGEEVWKVEIGSGVELFASPAVTRDRVYIGARDKNLRCLDRVTGKEIWKFTTRRDVDSSSVICASALYVGGMDGRLYAINPDSGMEIWSYEIGAGITASPAISSGTLVISSEDGVVYAFRESGK